MDNYQNGSQQQQYQQPQYQQQQQYQQPYQQQYQQPMYQNGQAYQTPPVQSYGQYEEPVTVGEWIITFIVLAIPLVGVIMLFVWAFGSGAKKSKKNLCLASLIMGLIGGAIGIILSIVFGGLAAVIGSGYF